MAINIKPSHKGLLRKKLGIKQGEPIPEKTLEKAKKKATGVKKKEIVFAENEKKWNHKGHKDLKKNPERKNKRRYDADYVVSKDED